MTDNTDEGGADNTDGARPEAEAQRAAERDALLERRRSRQMGGGKRGKKGRLLLAGTLSAAAVLSFVIAVGPEAALQILGITGVDTAPKTSQVDLEVEKLNRGGAPLDFVLPPKADEKTEVVDPNVEWNKRFEVLKKELEAVARANNKPEVSLSDVNDMLQRYNEQMAGKLAEERQKMAAENQRLRSEAERLQEEKRRAEEAARREEQRRRDQQETDDLQRESKGVVVDESTNSLASRGSFDANPDDLDNNDRFLAAASSSVFETTKSGSLADPSRTVVQGTIISAVLETAINTELPGNLRAQVTEPVFSFDGKRILMPAGTVLIGTFNNKVDVAQKRVLIAWNRAVTPEGKSVALGSTGTDLLGRAGTEGNVDNRFKTKFGAAVLISTITAIPTALASIGGGGKSNSGTTINVGSGSNSGGQQDMGVGQQVAGQLASNVGGQLAKQSSNILEKYLSLPPVIRIPQGEEIRVFVNRDLVFR
ncbi:TrbI/VirB10 family protein [Ensifer sp. YR511]|uniref:TrbI/VirB10 family protein n=1 Tax=Ensifer sp. YR511 TaxID=1855294 RepID=UPI00087F2E0B|nr:TrbI/VirB10 family protein [Ensifer sp. YR511]SDO11166.1 type IV secretion system protein VirB10 [Ensifer sp. YR511]